MSSKNLQRSAIWKMFGFSYIDSLHSYVQILLSIGDDQFKNPESLPRLCKEIAEDITDGGLKYGFPFVLLYFQKLT
jgi:hypothetical protein